MYGIFAIVYYGLTRHTVKKIRSEKYIVLLRKSLERLGNFKNSYNAYSIYYNSNLGTLPMQFSGNFIEQSLKNYDSKHFCYNIRKYFWTNVEVIYVGID